jgi:hypothetical protein
MVTIPLTGSGPGFGTVAGAGSGAGGVTGKGAGFVLPPVSKVPVPLFGGFLAGPQATRKHRIKNKKLILKADLYIITIPPFANFFLFLSYFQRIYPVFTEYLILSSFENFVKTKIKKAAREKTRLLKILFSKSIG